MAKKTITGKEYDQLKERIVQYVSTGFIEGLSESESQDECMNSLSKLFSHFESIKPAMRIKKKVVLKGYENDPKIADAVFNIKKVLSSYDDICKNIGFVVEYKSSALNAVSAKLICQRMKVALMNHTGSKSDIPSDVIEDAVCRMFNLISKDSYWLKMFNLQYLEKAFDSAFNASIVISNKIKTSVLDIVNLELDDSLL